MEHLMLLSASFVPHSFPVWAVKLFPLGLTQRFELGKRIGGYQVRIELMSAEVMMIVGLVLWLSDLGTALGIVPVPRNMFL